MNKVITGNKQTNDKERLDYFSNSIRGLWVENLRLNEKVEKLEYTLRTTHYIIIVAFILLALITLSMIHSLEIIHNLFATQSNLNNAVYNAIAYIMEQI